jgi:hypothetical protein
VVVEVVEPKTLEHLVEEDAEVEETEQPPVIHQEVLEQPILVVEVEEHKDVLTEVVEVLEL